MRRKGGIAVALVVLATAAGFGTAEGQNVMPGKKQPTSQQRSTRARGEFASHCRFTHRLPDDPIVKPGAPGASHMHDFVGNPSTNAFSTRASMLAAGHTTCRRTDDLSGYWVPTLYERMNPIAPSVTAYYLVGPRNPAFIRTFPAGLRVIAGDSHATEPQKRFVISWNCAKGRQRAQTKPPYCLHKGLVLLIRFPDCWDGMNLDSVDHKSHMAYSVPQRDGTRACPTTHRVNVPALGLRIVYDTHGGRFARLASGRYYTAHADFMNAWRQPALDALVQRCLNGNVNCRGNN
jgi:hypothetical protein